MSDPVTRAAAMIRERYAEPLTLDDMAEAAIFSKFHFSRLFRQTTGVSPGRFLTAVRLHEAKRLLITTQISVADISCLVGYTSLGTFTTRFTECVGVSPGKFRRLAEMGLLGPIPATPPIFGRPNGSLTGTVRVEPGHGSSLIFMGAFDRPIPQGKPNACLTLPHAGEWLMESVPEGVWYLMAVTLDHAVAGARPSSIERPMLVGRGGPVKIRHGSLATVNVTLRVPKATDPPVLLALPGLLDLPAPKGGTMPEGAAV